MKLLNLTLDNFKGTKHFSLDLPDGCSAAVYGENGTGKTTLADAWCWLLFGVDSKGQSDNGNGGFQVQTKGTSGLDYAVAATIDLDGQVHTLRRVYREQWTRKHGETQSVKTGNTTSFYLDDTPLKTKKQYDAFIDTLFPSREIGRALTIPSYFPGSLEPNVRRGTMLQLFASDATDDDVMARHPELERLRTYKGYKTVEQYRDWAKAQRAAINKELDSMPGRIDEASKAKREEVPLPEDEENHRHLQMEKAKVSMKINNYKDPSGKIFPTNKVFYMDTAVVSERKGLVLAEYNVSMEWRVTDTISIQDIELRLNCRAFLTEESKYLYNEAGKRTNMNLSNGFRIGDTMEVVSENAKKFMQECLFMNGVHSCTVTYWMDMFEKSRDISLQGAYISKGERIAQETIKRFPCEELPEISHQIKKIMRKGLSEDVITGIHSRENFCLNCGTLFCDEARTMYANSICPNCGCESGTSYNSLREGASREVCFISQEGENTLFLRIGKYHYTLDFR